VRVLHDYLAGRLQAVNTATSVMAVPATSQIGNATATRPMRPVSGATVRTRQTTATELARQQQEEGERKHKRNVAIGVVLGILAVVAIAIGVFSIIGSSSGTQKVPNLVNMTQEDAVAAIQETGWFEVGEIKTEYSDSVEEGNVIDQDPAAGKSFAKGTEITLYVSKGEEPAKDEQVPDLTDMTASEAEAELAKYNLVSKAGDGVYSEDVEVGHVAQQDPPAGTTIKAGDTVTYQLSLGVEEADVPDVTGTSESSATSKLQSAGFNVSVQYADSDTVEKGVVIRQSASGTAAKGSDITITVSSGSSKTSVPSVVGYSQADATSTLRNSGFAVNVSQQASSSVAAGVVISQSPGGGSSATNGTTVTITVSTGPASTGTGTDTDTGDATATQ